MKLIEQISGGFYIIERKQLRLQIVVLNTNLMKRSDLDEDAAKQWKWLERVLHKFQKNGETVCINFPNTYHFKILGLPVYYNVSKCS